MAPGDLFSQSSPRASLSHRLDAELCARQTPDGSLEGTLATLNITAQIAIVPNGRKVNESESNFRLNSRKIGIELGAGWNRNIQNTGGKYLSVSMSTPEFGSICGNIARVRGDDETKKVIIWNPAN